MHEAMPGYLPRWATRSDTEVFACSGRDGAVEEWAAMQWTYRQAARLQSTPAMVASIAVNLYKYILYCTYVIPRITHG